MRGSSRTKTRAVIFDLDGTLAESKLLYLNTIYRFVSKAGYAVSRRLVESSLGPRLPVVLRSLYVTTTKIPSLRKAINGFVTRKASKLRTCPYAKTVLKRLEKKVPLFLVTNSVKAYAAAFLKAHKLDKYFKLVIGGEEFESKEEAFKRIFSKLRLKPAAAFYVGDKISDIELAKKLGCRFAIVRAKSWDKAKLSNLPKEDAKHVIPTLKDLEI